MDGLQIVYWTGGGLIALIGVLWTVCSAIIKSIKDDFNANFRNIDERFNKMYEERGKNLEAIHVGFLQIREGLKDRPDFKHVDSTYQRLDVTKLQFQNIESAIENLSKKLDALAVMIKNGHGN